MQQQPPIKTVSLPDNCTLKVYAQLAHHRGNSAPYFSITADLIERGRLVSCGCMHDVIEEHCPGEFTDLIALHLSSDKGVPMHAAENGAYWAGLTKYKERDNAILAQHFRLSVAEAAALEFDFTGDVQAYVTECLPHWEVEAEAAIKRHNLEVVVTG